MVYDAGLDAMNGYAVYSAVQSGILEASALEIIQTRAPVPTPTPASLSKCPLPTPSPPSSTRPTSPLPRVSCRFRKAPQDWRLWIADHRHARGGQGTPVKSALIELADVA